MTPGPELAPKLDRSSTTAYASGEPGEFFYQRYGHTTAVEAETLLGQLDGGHALLFPSGNAAVVGVVLALLSPRSTVALARDAYYGVERLFRTALARWGVEVVEFDQTGPPPEGADLVWLETPSNPLLSFPPLRESIDAAHESGATVVVDATAATPILLRPLEHGADIVVHSATKYMGGHSDVVGGALVVADAALGDELAYNQNAMGGVPGPFDCWLVLRGLKTLGVRMDRHCANAERVVEMLLAHPRITQVLYPGLAEHPGHEVAAKQMKAYGGMVSFRVDGGEQAAIDVCNRAELFTLAESLGGVESLIEHPGRMTHASAAGSPLEVPADLVRLSVGIESVDDLLADLARALD